MYCDKCKKTPIKPRIVFFGEPLNPDYIEAIDNLEDDEPDLMIIMGTSLAVGPFNKDMTNVDCPKVLINMYNTAEHGFDFDNPEEYPDRLLLEGKCDEVLLELCDHCGWKDDLVSRKYKFKVDANGFSYYGK